MSNNTTWELNASQLLLVVDDDNESSHQPLSVDYALHTHHHPPVEPYHATCLLDTLNEDVLGLSDTMWWFSHFTFEDYIISR